MTHPRVGHPIAGATPSDRPTFVPIHDRAGRWRVQAAWRERLIGPDAPDWFRLHDDRRATRVKQGRGRSVWRVELGDVAVFAKVMQPSGLTSRMKALLIGNPARREWEALMACAARGVPVPEALGLGMQASGGAYALITLGIEPVRTFLGAWLEASKAKEGRRGRTLPLIRSAARLFATAHERGVWHRDAHPGNVLVRATGDEIEVLFTDLLGTKMTRNLPDLRSSLQSLVQFDQRMQRLATRTERLRFLREYLKARGRDAELSRGDLGGLLIIKQQAQLQHADRLAQQWDRRLRGDGKYFSRVRLKGGWHGVVVLRPERTHFNAEPQIKDRTLAEWEPILRSAVKGASHNDNLIKTPMQCESQQASSILARLQWTIAGSPAQDAFLEAHRMRHRDKKASPPPGYLERRCWGLIDRCMLFN